MGLKVWGEVTFGGIGMAPMTGESIRVREVGRAWPMGVAAVALVGTAWGVSQVDWPSRTWSVIAIGVALLPWIRAAYLAMLGRRGGAAASWGAVGLVIVGVGVVGDGMQIENQMPPGWPAEVPRYPGAWTGRGSVRAGERTWFVRTTVGRTSPHEVTYEAAYPHVERMAFGSGDGCTTYRVESTRLRVCPEGEHEVVVSLESTAARDAHR